MRVALLAILVLAGLAPTATPVAAVGACATSGPPSASYAVTVCLTVPLDGAVLSGPATVSGTVSVSGTSPGVQKIVFFLRGAYLLTDFATPYTFSVATNEFVDGAAGLEIEADMRDGFASSRALVNVTLANGVTSPPVNTNTFSPTLGTWSGSGPIVVAAAGDGASGEPNAQAATDLIASWNSNLFLYLGDVYEKGSRTEFDNWYGNATTFYGRFRPKTNPTIGNHEYEGSVAPGYFDYWDNVPHYYSYTIGPWHFVSLDSTSQYNQAGPGSGQYNWLVDDLTANTSACTLVYFHHPVFSAGPQGDTTRMNAIWSLLAQRGVDIVLTGHDHDYQRWQPLDGAGNPSPAGPTQFVVGTGGHGIQGFVRTDARLAVGFDSSPAAIGALRLSLSDGLAGYEFVNTAGMVRDQGTIGCQPGATDTTPPTAPSGLSATALAANRVELAWMASTDNVGVAAYDIYRDGAFRTSVGSATTTWTDTTVTGQNTYTYTVTARDLSSNTSPSSNSAVVTTPAGGGVLLFSDGFESGTLAAWTNAGGVTVQGAEVFAGANAARAVATNGAAWAWHGLSPTLGELYYRVRFKIVSSGANNVYVLKERTSTGGSIVGFYRSSSDSTLNYRNDAAGVTVRSTTPVSLGVWHELQVHLRINGISGEVETWLDSVRVADLSRTDNFGTSPVGRIQIGDNSGLRTFDLALDDVAVNDSFISDAVFADTTPPSPPGGPNAQAPNPTRVDLSWLPSTDDVGVVAYDIYRNGDTWDSVLGSASSYADTTVDPGTTYTYVVRARDLAGNVSPPSASATVTTPGAPDTTPPSVPADVTATPMSTSRIDVDWSPSSDDVGVMGYTVYRDGVAIATVGAGATAYSDTGLAPLVRAAFYYPWFPEAWDQGGIDPYTNFQPDLGRYDGASASVIARHIEAMRWAGLEAGIASWWGQGMPTDAKIPALLAAAHGLPFRWSLYHEGEGQGDPSVASIAADLVYIRDHYAVDPGYLWIGSRFVVFVYADAGDACAMADRWEAANTVGAFIVLKVFTGYGSCASQPDGWHQYAPAVARDSQIGYSFAVSPGFWKVGELPRLARDLARFRNDVQAMVASGAPFQLVTTFNEWGEGTAVEGATEWTSASGFGSYLDVLHDVLAPASSHSYEIDAFDAAGLHSARSPAVAATTLADTTPPAEPTGLAAPTVAFDQVVLTWSAANDDVGVVGYDVYRNGGPSAFGSVGGSTLTWTDTTVAPATPYSYLVKARDLAGNPSGPSNQVSVTTPGAPDVTPPSVPGDVTATPISSSRIDLDWSASNDDVGVTGYTVYRDGSFLATTGPGTTAFSDTGLAPDTSHSYEIDAVDAAGLHSARSTAVVATTLADTTPPSAPTGLAAPTVAFDRVVLTWSAASDDVGVVAYDVYRNGGPLPLASVGGSTLTWTDTTVAPATPYSYVVKARDLAGNPSGPSNQVNVTTPATAPPLFVDGFESGALGAWTNIGLTVQSTTVHSGTYAARALSTGSPTWAWAALSSPSSEVYVRAWIRMASSPQKTTTLLKLRTATGTSILGLLVTNKGRLSYRNDAAGRTVNGTTVISAGVWHEVVIHLKVNGAAGSIEVWLDGVLVPSISGTDNFGTTSVGRLQLAENQSARPFDFAFDDVEVRQQPF